MSEESKIVGLDGQQLKEPTQRQQLEAQPCIAGRTYHNFNPLSREDFIDQKNSEMVYQFTLYCTHCLLMTKIVERQLISEATKEQMQKMAMERARGNTTQNKHD